MKLPLPPKVHAPLSIGLLLLLLVLLWGVAIYPALSSRVESRERLRAVSAEINRFGKAAAVQPALREEIAKLKVHVEKDPGFLREPSEAQAAAAVQSQVQAVISKHGGKVRSVQPFNQKRETLIPLVAVRVEAQGTLLALSNAFIELSHATPVLYLDNVQLQPQRPGAIRQGVPGGDQLDARFDATGAWLNEASP